MNKSEQQPVRKVDARGLYSPHGRPSINVRTPEDLIKAGIEIGFQAAKATWGEQQAANYVGKMMAKRK